MLIERLRKQIVSQAQQLKLQPKIKLKALQANRPEICVSFAGKNIRHTSHIGKTIWFHLKPRTCSKARCVVRRSRIRNEYTAERTWSVYPTHTSTFWIRQSTPGGLVSRIKTHHAIGQTYVRLLTHVNSKHYYRN